MSEKLKRKGQLVRDQEGSLVIVDEENKGYKVDDVIATVWAKSNNKTTEEVVDDVTKEAKDVDKSTIKEAVETIVADLKKVNLLA